MASLLSDYISWYAQMVNFKWRIAYTSVDHVLMDLRHRSQSWSKEGKDAANAWIARIQKATEERFQGPPNADMDRVFGMCPALAGVLASCENKRWVEVGEPQLLELKQYLSTVPERGQIMQALLPFLYNIYKKPAEPCHVRPLYIYGEPGTGKTYFVKEIGRILGLPIIPMSSLTGEYRDYGEPTDSRSLRLEMNKFSSACITSETKQFILLVDECEYLIEHNSPSSFNRPLEFFLELFGSDEPMMDNCLKRAFPKHFVLVVFVANSLLKGDTSTKPKYLAFMDRLVPVEFANKTDAQKYQLAVSRNKQKGGLLDDERLWRIVREDKRSGMRGVLNAVDMAIADTNAKKALACFADDQTGGWETGGSQQGSTRASGGCVDPRGRVEGAS